MSLAQENFESAIHSGRHTLRELSRLVDNPGLFHTIFTLRKVNTRRLNTLAWDLEAIQAAIRVELNNRSEAPTDLG